MSNNLRVAIQWNRFGPYHIARLVAAYEAFAKIGVELVGIETASHDNTYGWASIQDATPFKRHVILPDSNSDEVSATTVFLRAWQVASQVKPDVMVIAGYSTFDAYSLLTWAKLNRRPSIIMSESRLDDKKRTKVRELLKRIILRQSASALCGGTPHKEYLQSLGVSPDRIVLGYDAVDNDYFSRNAQLAKINPHDSQHLPGLKDQTPFFLASSRFVRRKNLHGLLQAYRRYRTLFAEGLSYGEPWRLVILGDGEERSSLEHMIRSNSLEGVTLAGFRQIGELPSYYGLASAFIHPALQEQWGLVVNEAMASRLPVIVSKSTGCARDLVIQGQTGFVFDPEDYFQLSDLMHKFSSGELDLASIGQAGHEHIKYWGLDRFADGLLTAVKLALTSAPNYHSILQKLEGLLCES